MPYRFGASTRRFFLNVNYVRVANNTTNALKIHEFSGLNAISNFFSNKRHEIVAKNRHLRKLADDNVLRDDAAVYSSVHEDLSTASTKQDSSSVEFSKKFNDSYLELQMLNLKEQTVLEYYETSAIYKQSIPTNIQKIMDMVPKNPNPQKRIESLVNLLYKYPPIPVVTSHPTRIFTNFAIYQLYEIINLALQLDDITNHYELYLTNKKLNHALNQLLINPFIQKQKLTPQQEVEYGEFIYRKSIESFPTFFNLLVDAVYKEYQLDREHVAKTLEPVCIFLYSNLRSWKVGDRDGNESKDKHTMGAAIPEQQVQNLIIYINKTEEIISLIKNINCNSENDLTTINYVLNRLNTSVTYYKESIKSIRDSIWFDEAGSESASKTSIDKLNLVNEKLREILTNSNQLEHIVNKIADLTNLIKLCKFTGGYTHYHRQTTQLNTRIFDNIFQILLEDGANSVIDILLNKNYIKDLLQLSNNVTFNCVSLCSNDKGPFIKLQINREDKTKEILELEINKKIIRKYSELPLSEKIKLQNLISKDSNYFVRLRANKHKFTQETEKEFGVLDFIFKNKDMFRYYIFSNTETKNNFDEGSILIRLAQFIVSDNLHIGEMNKYPLDFLFLLESPNDMKNLEILLDNIFNDRHLRAKISHSGFISAVLGPSDLGKEGGIVTYLTLYLAQMRAEELLLKYKKIYPELKDVYFLFLYGFGSDWKRYIGGTHMHSHVTLQGIDAYKVIGAPFGFLNFVSGVSGRKPEGNLKVLELRKIRDNYPDLFNLLVNLENLAVPNFEEFIKQVAVKDLVAILGSDEVEDATNCSSRKKSKNISESQDFKKLRAIGVVNVFIYMIFHFDIFMGMRGWEALKLENNADLHELYSRSSIIRDIVEKGLYALAFSDINRSWKLINQGEIPSRAKVMILNTQYHAKYPEERTVHEVMAYIQISAEIVLRKLMLFASPEKQPEIKNYLQHNISKPIQAQTLDLLNIVGGRFYKLANETRLIKIDADQLAKIISYHSSEKNSESKFLVAAGIRGGSGSLFAGPKVFNNRRAEIEDMAVDNNNYST